MLRCGAERPAGVAAFAAVASVDADSPPEVGPSGMFRAVFPAAANCRVMFQAGQALQAAGRRFARWSRQARAAVQRPADEPPSANHAQCFSAAEAAAGKQSASWRG
ncbi:hypothetical protein B0T37_09590 [Chromobacterium violaceum]|nr:hypothetical protein B0T38_08620 [Chromobacterium violaceum]OQS27163.1 hypothetical protein B0T37_09590 [Chromobacterium violaceum]